MQALGLVTVRHFGRLMPLLLPWCWAPDEGTRLQALQALDVLLRCCWPRIPAHRGECWLYCLAAAVAQQLWSSPHDHCHDASSDCASTCAGPLQATINKAWEEEHASGRQHSVQAATLLNGMQGMLQACQATH